MNDSNRPIRLLIAGGGTGGHVLPAVAVIEELRRRNAAFEAHWIGGHKGVERQIATEQGVPFTAIQTGKLRKYIARETFVDPLRIIAGTMQSYLHVRSFRPDIIYSTGGAVSVPTVVAKPRRTPVLTHEQTAQIGIANRVVSRFARTFAVGFEETAAVARVRHSNVVVTGNPVRGSLQGGSAGAGLAQFGFSGDLPVVYVTGGALGASPLNERVEAILPELLQHSQVLHQAGPASANDDVARLIGFRERLPEALRGRYQVRDFIRQELPDVYAMADLVVARAGAGTVSELGFLGLPAILVPLPSTWGDEQRKNAQILSGAGAAVVLEQAIAAPERLLSEIITLLHDPDRRAAMAVAARSTSRPDAASRLVDELLKLAGANQRE